MPAVGGGGSSNKQFQIEFLLKIQDAATAVLKQVQNEMGKLGQGAQEAGQSMQKSMTGMATSATMAAQKLEQMSGSLFALGAAASGLGVTLTAAFKGIIDTSAGFQDSMLAVKAITGATDDQFKSLNTIARQLGAATKFTATEAAEGMKFLGMAGFDTNQIIAAMPSTLNLAEANAMGLGQAADYVSNIMQGFGLQAEETARATDVLAMTAKSSNTNVAQLAEGMKYVAPVARAVGASIEETAAAMGALGDAGIQASMGGTSLRRILLQLTSPTAEASAALQRMGVQVAKNADGNVNLTETFKRLRDANMGAAEAEQIFGVYAVSSAIALKDNLNKFEQLTQKNLESKGALDLWVETVRSSFVGAVTRLTSAFSGLVEAMGAPLLQPIARAIDAITSVISKLAEWAQAYPTVSGAIAGFIGVAGLVAGIIGAIGIALAGLGFLMRPFIQGWAFLKQTMMGVVEASGGVVGASARTKNALMSEGAQVDTLAKQYHGAVAAKERLYKAQASAIPTQAKGGGKIGKSEGAMIAGAAIGGVSMAAGELTKGTDWAKAGDQVAKYGGILGGTVLTLGGLAWSFSQIKVLLGPISLGIAATATAVAGLAAVTAAAVGGPMYLLLRSWGKQKEELHNLELAAAGLKKTTSDAMIAMSVATQKSGKDQQAAIVKTAETYAKAGKSIEDLSKDYAANFGEKLPDEAKKAFTATKTEIDNFFTESSKKARDTDWIKVQMGEFVELQRAIGNAHPTLIEFNKIYKQAFGHDLPREHAVLWREIADREKNARDKMEEFDMAAIKAMENTAGGADRAKMSLKDLYEDTKKTADELQKRETEIHKNRIGQIDIETAQEKAAIAERIASNQQEQVALIELEARAQERRTQEVQAQALRRLTIETETYEKLKENLQKQIDTATGEKEKEEAQKKLSDLERKHSTELVKIQADLTEKLAKEIESQLKKRSEYVNKIQELEKQLIDTQRNTSQLLRNLDIGAADQYSQITMKLADANAKLREAEELFPKYPERAVELAKQAQSEFAALGQAIAQLQENLKSNTQLITDTIRDIKNVGLKGIEKYFADRGTVLDLMQRAEEEKAAGRLKEAEALYKQAIGQAKGLATSAPANVREEAKADAIRLVTTAGERLKEVNQQQIDKAEAVNESAREGIREAGAILESNIKQQIENTNRLIAALDKNTAALQGRYEQAKSGAAEGVGGQTSTSASYDRPVPAEMTFTPTSSVASGSVAGGIKDRLDSLKNNMTSSIQANLDMAGSSGIGQAFGGLLERFSSPAEKMDSFAQRMERAVELMMKAAQLDSNINITVNADGSVSMSRGGGQYDNY